MKNKMEYANAGDAPVDNEHQGLLAVLRKYFDEK